jgi:hypothetical protein
MISLTLSIITRGMFELKTKARVCGHWLVMVTEVDRHLSKLEVNVSSNMLLIPDCIRMMPMEL